MTEHRASDGISDEASDRGSDQASDEAADGTTAIEVYWRPGCGFCMLLDRQLAKHGFATVRHNIWDDPADAAFVRSVAHGHETVPTVVVGEVALVNPSLGQVVDLLRATAPHLVPDGYEARQPGPLARLAERLLHDG